MRISSLLLFASLTAFGCDVSQVAPDDSGATDNDFAVAKHDFAVAKGDLATAAKDDLATTPADDLALTPADDLASAPNDLAMSTADLAMANDLGVAQDMAAATGDMAKANDLSVVADMSVGADMTKPADMSTTSDMAGASDMSTPANHLNIGVFRGSTLGSSGYYLNLAFWNMAGSTGQLCIPEQIGPCVVLDCINPTASGSTRPKYSLAANAGTVSVTNGITKTTMAKLANGLYDLSSNSPSPYGGGSTLTVSGTGGADVPAFTATATQLSLVTVTSPTLSSMTTNNISRSKDFTATWTTTGVTDFVEITFGQELLSSGSFNWPDLREAHCRFDASAGTGTVPAAVLQRFDPANTNSYGLIGHSVMKTVTAGNYVIDVDFVTYKIWDAAFQ